MTKRRSLSLSGPQLLHLVKTPSTDAGILFAAGGTSLAKKAPRRSITTELTLTDSL